MSGTTKGRGRALRKGRPIKVQVTVDPARKSRFDELAAVLRKARRDEAEGFDTYWEAVGEILDAELYVVGGYDTPDAFLANEVKVPRRTALRLVRVAKYASPRDEELYGTAVLDGALAYIEALSGGPISGKLPVAFDKLRIPVQRDGETKKLLLKEVTLEDLRRATSEKLRGSKKSRVQRPPHETALQETLAKVPALKGVSVRVAGGKVNVTGAPIEALAALAKALASAKLPPLPAGGAGKAPAAATKKKAARARNPG